MPTTPEGALQAFFQAFNQGDIEAVMALLTDFTERTHPISGGPLRFLSEVTNAATLASWRRIQLMAKERTSVRMQAQIKFMSEQGYSGTETGQVFCWIVLEC